MKARAQRDFEDLLRHDRAVVVAALVFVIAISWLYLLAGAGTGMSVFEMSSLSLAMGQAMTAMAAPADWTWAYALLMLGMWWVMMIAMMLPSAAPMILLFALVNRRRHAKSGPHVRTAVFAGAYLVAWEGSALLRWRRTGGWSGRSCCRR